MTKDSATLARELEAAIAAREDEIQRLRAAVLALKGQKRRGRPPGAKNRATR